MILCNQIVLLNIYFAYILLIWINTLLCLNYKFSPFPEINMKKKIGELILQVGVGVVVVVGGGGGAVFK